MAQQIETHHPVERCPERSHERYRVFNGQQLLRHIHLQNPDNRLQRHRHHLLTARARLKSGNSSAKQYSIVTRIGQGERPVGPSDLLHECVWARCLWHPFDCLAQARASLQVKSVG